MCSTPIHVTSSQLIASEIFPVPVVKALLFPGAIANGIVRNMTIPHWDNLLDIYNLTSVKEAPAVTDLQRLEVLLFNFSSPSLLFWLLPGGGNHIPLFFMVHKYVLKETWKKIVNTNQSDRKIEVCDCAFQFFFPIFC